MWPFGKKGRIMSDRFDQLDEAVVALSKEIAKLQSKIEGYDRIIKDKDSDIRELRSELKERTAFSEKLLLLMLHNQKEEASKPKKSALEIYMENKKANGADTAGPKGKLP